MPPPLTTLFSSPGTFMAVPSPSVLTSNQRILDSSEGVEATLDREEKVFSPADQKTHLHRTTRSGWNGATAVFFTERTVESLTSPLIAAIAHAARWMYLGPCSLLY